MSVEYNLPGITVWYPAMTESRDCPLNSVPPDLLLLRYWKGLFSLLVGHYQAEQVDRLIPMLYISNDFHSILEISVTFFNIVIFINVLIPL